MSKVAIYLRVSTLEQAERGYSLGEQESRLRSYCDSKGWAVHKVYKDDGYSGGSLDRPGIQNLIQEIDGFDIVLVYRLDRLSRSQKDTLHLIEDVFLKREIAFISLNESFDTSTPFGRAMIGILSVFAQLERENIRERMAMGRIGRAKQGYYHGGGNYDPLGYDYIDGELIINEYERDIVEDIFSLYSAGNSMAETARIIHNKYPERIRSQTIVKDALSKQIYIGNVEFDGEIYPGRHTPIIDRKLFDKVQQIKKKRAVGATKTNKRKGLLVGKIYCKQCGARYHRTVSGPIKYRYIKYACYSRRRSKATAAMVKDPNCKNKIWDEKALDQKIIDHLKDFDFTNHEVKESDTQSRIDHKEKQLTTIDNQLSKLKDIYMMDLLTKEELQTKSKILLDRKKLLEKEISELNIEPDGQELIQTLKTFDWDGADKKDYMILIDTLIDYIEIGGDSVYVYLKF